MCKCSDTNTAVLYLYMFHSLHWTQGNLLLQLGRTEEAGFCIRHAAELNVVLASSATQRALVHNYLGNYQLSIEALKAFPLLRSRSPHVFTASTLMNVSTVCALPAFACHRMLQASAPAQRSLRCWARHRWRPPSGRTLSWASRVPSSFSYALQTPTRIYSYCTVLNFHWLPWTFSYVQYTVQNTCAFQWYCITM